MPINYGNGGSAYEAERLNDGLGNIVTAADAKDAVDKKHTQGTDQGLDTGGPNATTAAGVKGAVDDSHVQGTDQGLDTGGGNATTAAEVKGAVTHSTGTGAPHTAAGVGADAAGAAAGAVGTHEGTYAHGDIATNSGARHTQGTDQALDTGGGNEVTAANAKDAVSKKHTQNSDTFLDEGNANEVTAANAADAVTKKHDRSHALDDTSDHSIGSGTNGQVIGVTGGALGWLTPAGGHTRLHDLDSASDHSIGSGTLGQCIGVVSGPALGWVTPGGGGGTPVYVDKDFPVAKDWATDGAGTAGGWVGSGDLTDFDTLEFSGDELVFALANSSGVSKNAYFYFDLSADYYSLTYTHALMVHMLSQMTASGSTSAVQMGLIQNGGYYDEELNTAMNEHVSAGYYASMHVENHDDGDSININNAYSAGADTHFMSYQDMDKASLSVSGSSLRDSATVALTKRHLWDSDGTFSIKIRILVGNGATMSGKIKHFWAGPLFPLP